MPEDTCAPRIAALSEQIQELEGRAAELAAMADDTEKPERMTAADLDALRRERLEVEILAMTTGSEQVANTHGIASGIDLRSRAGSALIARQP